jgi:hypothetical protein
MSEEFSSILDSSFANGQPFIDYTEFYCYVLAPQGDGTWLEASFDLGEKSVEKRQLSATKAFNNLCEELEKGISEAVEDFQLFKWKEFKKTLTGDDNSKVIAAISEVSGHVSSYSANLPVITSAEELDKIKGKL